MIGGVFMSSSLYPLLLLTPVGISKVSFFVSSLGTPVRSFSPHAKISTWLSSNSCLFLFLPLVDCTKSISVAWVSISDQRESGRSSLVLEPQQHCLPNEETEMMNSIFARPA